jgi:5-methylcytosine-specific restriction endonuclease McrA
LNNQFPIKETYLLSLEKEKYKGKYFRDLSSEDRSRIRNYNFTLNKLDGSYRTDRDKLRDMYEILNRSSRTLNDYEFNKVILSPFYTIIEEYKDMFIQSGIFKQMKDSRGSVDTEIIEMIALSEELQGSWSSVHALKEEWIKKTIGETAEKVAQYVGQKGEDLKAKLLFMTKIIDEFSRLDFFSDNSKTDKRYYIRHYISYKFIVSRCVRWIHNIAMFHRVLSNIIAKFKRDILVEDIQTRLECTSRSSTFQKRLMEKIDAILKEEVHAEGSARLFSKKQIQNKLEEQENKCALCHLAISFLDKYEGDHIIPWTAGGKTFPENLQVVHRRCHQLYK